MSKFSGILRAVVGAALVFGILLGNPDSASAHFPHDDIFTVEMSPDYQQDRTVFINVRGNLFKSGDGGASWQTVVNGLDHQHELSALDIARQSGKVLYLATFGDGIYKSENEGDSWREVNRGLENLNIDLVKISPNSSNVVLAAGTEAGLYATDNGGSSWSSVMEDKITAIAFDPTDNNKTIVGDEQGNLFASSDRGNSWQQLATLENSGAVSAIAVSPNLATDRTWWAGTERGVYRTVDGGNTWNEVNRGLSDRQIVSLAISPNYQTDSTLLASTWHGGVFRSTDGGSSWSKSKGMTKDGQADLPNFQRPHFSDLSISPSYSQDGTVFAAGFDGLFKSTDGGRVWREVDTLSSYIIVGFDLSPDYQQDSTVAVTTYLGGAYISHDGGASWKTINRGLYKDGWLKRTVKQILQDNYVARLFGIAFSPNYSQDRTIFAPSWTEFLKSTNRGRQWQKIPLTNRPTKYAIAVSPNFAEDKTIYLGSMQGTGEDGILKSTDGGLNFSKVGEIEGQPVVYLEISPNFTEDKTLYAGVKDGIYQTVDGGSTWQLVSNGLPELQRESTLAISPNYQGDRTVFAGTSAGLFVTRDGGNSWDKLSEIAGETGYIESVAVSPDYERDRTLIISVRGRGLFKSVDGGTTFMSVGSNLLARNRSLGNMYGFWPPTTGIKFSPAYDRDRTIYGVSETKLFKSTDGGHTWANMPIPTPQGTSLIQLITYNYLRLSVAPITKFLVAALVALASYFALERLRWSRLRWRNIFIKTGGAFTAFMLVFILFSVYLSN